MVWVIWNLHELGPANSVGTIHEFLEHSKLLEKNPLTIICLRGGLQFLLESLFGNWEFGNWRTKLKHKIALDWFVVSTHLKNISQNGNLPQIGVKIKHIWNHHPVDFWFLEWRCDLCLDDHGSMSWPRSPSKNGQLLAAPACIDSFFSVPCLHLTEDLLEHILQQDAHISHMGAYLCTTLCVWFNVQKGVFQQQVQN